MKNKKIVAILMAAFMILGLVACGGSNSDTKTTGAQEGTAQASGSQQAEAKPAGEAVKIKVILKTTASDYWSYVQAGALSYMKDHPEVQVEVTGASSEIAFDEQSNIIETSVNDASINGLVIAPLQADTTSEKISNANMPIVAVDTKIESPKVSSFVGTGNYDASKLGGKAAVEEAKKRGWKELKAISISGVQGESTATDRMNGYKDGITEAGGEYLESDVQYADAVADKAVNCIEAIMQNHPEGIAMIVCNNDDIAISAARTAKSNPAYANTVFVGFDGNVAACDSILADEETLSVAQDAYGMGYKAVEACHKVIQGEKIDSFIDSGATMITKENANERKETLNSYTKKQLSFDLLSCLEASRSSPLAFISICFGFRE